MCSATGSGHVITCTARRWVVSGRLYCFQHPPANSRREACKPSTDPTSRITNVRINRTAAHRSIFRQYFVAALCHTQSMAAPPRLVLAKNPAPFSNPAFAEPPCSTQSTAAASRHRQDEKSRRRSGVYLFRCTAAPRLGEKSSQFSVSTGGVPSSAGRKILLIFPTRYSPSRLAVHKVQRRRPVIGRTKNYSSSSDRICSINRS